jgi:hypothetical protein
VAFEVIAAAAPPVSTAKVAYSAAFAVSDAASGAPEAVLKDVLSNLPDQAQQELRQTLSKASGSGTLYAVVFAGQQPSAGYRVSVDAVQRQSGKLVVQYHVMKPDPQQAHAEVITFPYVIVRIPNAGSAPADVRFENKPL